MQIAAAACPRGALTGRRYQDIGKYSISMVKVRFGSWNSAMWLAFPKLMEQRNFTIENLVADVQRTADKLRKYAASSEKAQFDRGNFFKLSRRFYEKNGTYGWYDMFFTLREHFGVKTWVEVKRAIGITDV